MLRALTIRQPWAAHLVSGKKDHETRSWKGPLEPEWIWIHAAKYGHKLGPEWDVVATATPGSSIPWQPIAYGCLVGIGRYMRSYETKDHKYRVSDADRALGDYEHGRYAWHFLHMWYLDDPIPCRGRQGLWIAPTGHTKAMATNKHNFRRASIADIVCGGA